MEIISSDADSQANRKANVCVLWPSSEGNSLTSDPPACSHPRSPQPTRPWISAGETPHRGQPQCELGFSSSVAEPWRRPRLSGKVSTSPLS